MVFKCISWKDFPLSKAMNSILWVIWDSKYFRKFISIWSYSSISSSSIPITLIRNAYSKAVSSQCMKRPPSPKCPPLMLVFKMTDLEQVGHVLSLTLATHLAASQTPTLDKANKKIVSSYTASSIWYRRLKVVCRFNLMYKVGHMWNSTEMHKLLKPPAHFLQWNLLKHRILLIELKATMQLEESQEIEQNL